jgi:hypothetical protein
MKILNMPFFYEVEAILSNKRKPQKYFVMEKLPYELKEYNDSNVPPLFFQKKIGLKTPSEYRVFNDNYYTNYRGPNYSLPGDFLSHENKKIESIIYNGEILHLHDSLITSDEYANAKKKIYSDRIFQLEKLNNRMQNAFIFNNEVYIKTQGVECYLPSYNDRLLPSFHYPVISDQDCGLYKDTYNIAILFYIKDILSNNEHFQKHYSISENKQELDILDDFLSNFNKDLLLPIPQEDIFKQFSDKIFNNAELINNFSKITPQLFKLLANLKEYLNYDLDTNFNNLKMAYQELNTIIKNQDIVNDIIILSLLTETNAYINIQTQGLNNGI